MGGSLWLLRDALKEVILRRSTLDKLAAQRAAVEQSIREESSEQQRLRDNLKSLNQTETLADRYVKKLAASEDALESLRQKLAKAKHEEEEFKKDYEEFVANLDAI